MIERLRIGVGILLLIGMSVLLVRSQQILPYQNPPRENGSNHTENYEGHTKISGPLQIECDPNCSRKEAEEKRYDGRFSRLLDKTIEDPVSFWTCLLGVATLLLGAGVFIQIRDARISSERQLRAYVVIASGGITLVNLREGGLGIQIHIILKNSGKTPGYRFSTWYQRPEILDPDANPFTDSTPLEKRNGSSIIGPGADVNLSWTLVSTPELRSDIESGKKRIFVWGGADFVDAFGENRFFIFRDINGLGPSFALAGHQLALTPHKLGYDAN